MIMSFGLTDIKLLMGCLWNNMSILTLGIQVSVPVSIFVSKILFTLVPKIILAEPNLIILRILVIEETEVEDAIFGIMFPLGWISVEVGTSSTVPESELWTFVGNTGFEINAEDTIFVELHVVSGVTISIFSGVYYTFIISERKGTLGSICWVVLVAVSMWSCNLDILTSTVSMSVPISISISEIFFTVVPKISLVEPNFILLGIFVIEETEVEDTINCIMFPLGWISVEVGTSSTVPESELWTFVGKMGLKINAEQTVFVKLHMVSGVTISILLG